RANCELRVAKQLSVRVRVVVRSQRYFQFIVEEPANAMVRADLRGPSRSKSAQDDRKKRCDLRGLKPLFLSGLLSARLKACPFKDKPETPKDSPEKQKRRDFSRRCSL